MASSIICVGHLTKSYGGRKVVNDLSFEVGKGEIFALLGYNGSLDSITEQAASKFNEIIVLGGESCVTTEAMKKWVIELGKT